MVLAHAGCGIARGQEDAQTSLGIMPWPALRWPQQKTWKQTRHGNLDKGVEGAMHPADSENNLAVFSEVEDARISGQGDFLGAQEI